MMGDSQNNLAGGKEIKMKKDYLNQTTDCNDSGPLNNTFPHCHNTLKSNALADQCPLPDYSCTYI